MNLENRDYRKTRHYLARGFKYFPHFGSYNGRNAYLKLCLQIFCRESVAF
jgi:hypothetical protein